MVPRPVALSFAFPHGQVVDIAAVGLRDSAGRELVANGGFAGGTARWLFTDDDDTAWRIMNLYLQLFFETGAIGLAVFVIAFFGLRELAPRLRDQLMVTMRDRVIIEARAAGLKVEDIDYVMCTHLHVDHVGWNTRLENGRWVPTFPKAKYIFHKREYDAW